MLHQDPNEVSSLEPREGSRSIGTLNEKSLHAALKEWYRRPGDRLEVEIEGFVVDIVRDGLLIEIQTRNFAAIKAKLIALAERHPTRLVYPIAERKWIVKVMEDGQTPISRRRSPKHGTFELVFGELVRFPTLLANPQFSLDVILIHEEEQRRHEVGKAWRRKGWVTHDRRLLQVVDRRLFESPRDLADLIPADLDGPFTTADLAQAIHRPRWLAQKMAYCLREMSIIERIGQQGNAYLYTRAVC